MADRKPIASYLLRVNLFEHESQTLEEYKNLDSADPAGPVPTVEALSSMVRQEIYNNVDYFYYDDIHVTGERLDK